MVGTRQAASSDIFLRMKKRRCAPSRSMKGVPGVMQLLSKTSPSGLPSPFLSAACAACRCTSCLHSSSPSHTVRVLIMGRLERFDEASE
jgi:hypothetical protein